MDEKNLSFINQSDLYQQILERMPVHIYWKNTNFEYLDCNKLQATNVGLNSPSDIVGKTDYDFFPQPLADQIRKNDTEVLRSGKPCIFDENFLETDGKHPVYLTHKIPLINANGDIIGLAGISFDITSRKLKEDKIRIAKEAAEHTLASILENLPGHVYWKNKDSVYQGCNLAQAQSAGLSAPEQIIGKTDYDMPWKHEAQILRESDLAVIHDKKTLTREEASQLANTDYVSIFLSKKSPLLNSKGEVVGILGVSFDITDRKKMEEDLEKAKELAEIANQTKTEFLANMRHDIRTPLSGIVGFSEVLKGQTDDPTLKEYLQNLTASAYALSDFLNEVLEAMRVSSGEIPKLKRKFHLNKVFGHIKDLYAAKANEKSLLLKLELDPKLPQFVIGDKIRLHRIALELVGNALNFTDEGEIILSIQLAKKEDQKLVIKLTVKDTGLGIPEDKQQEIYLQFKRLTPSYQGIYKGAGLGLYVVKQFINELEGEIYVDSTPGQGTCFTCLIPLQAPLLDDDSGIEDKDELQYKPYMAPLNYLPSSSPALAVTSSQSPTAATVLIVEDNEIAQKAAKAFLIQMNCNVELASSGEDAIVLCKQKKYDLIFMDIGLGGMDGYEVTSFIRKQDGMQDIPIVALTGHGGEENRQRCIDVGMNAVITKPLTHAQATDILKAFIPEKHPVAPEPQKPTTTRRDLPDNDEELFQLEQFDIFDYNTALKNYGNKALIIDLITMLTKEQLPDEVTKLKKAFSEKDYPLIEHITHTLKGSALCICAIRMKYACQYVERYWKTGETKLFELLYQQALRVIDQTSTYFTEWLEKNS